MSTATVLQDRPLAISERDENTIITDYWLNYMSVRRLDQSPSAFPRRDLELKVDELCRRLDTLLVERKTLADKLDRARKELRSEFGAGLKAASPPRLTAGPEQLSRPITQPCRGSLLGRVAGLFLGIQKLL